MNCPHFVLACYHSGKINGFLKRQRGKSQSGSGFECLFRKPARPQGSRGGYQTGDILIFSKTYDINHDGHIDDKDLYTHTGIVEDYQNGLVTYIDASDDRKPPRIRLDDLALRMIILMKRWQGSGYGTENSRPRDFSRRLRRSVKESHLKDSPRWFWPVLVFLSTQLMFLYTLNPAFQNDDSAETITAGATLGLQHPPSYALTALVGRVQWLLPLGGFEFRANWGSSLWASFDSALLTFLIIWLIESLFFNGVSFSNSWVTIFCGVWGGFSLAMAPAYWHNALNAKGEVYLLSVFFQLLILTYMAIGERDKNIITARVLGLPLFLIGLGLSNHWETFVIFIPAIFIFFLLIKRRRLAGWIQGVSFLILGVSPLIFLPLRAHLNPALNFGEPDKINYFWADLFRTYYSYREVSLWGMLADLLKSYISLNQFLIFLHQLVQNKSETLLFNLGQDIGWFSFGLAVFRNQRLASVNREKSIIFFIVVLVFTLGFPFFLL